MLLREKGALLISKNPELNKNAWSIVDAKRQYDLDGITNSQIGDIVGMKANNVSMTMQRYPNEFSVGLLSEFADEIQALRDARDEKINYRREEMKQKQLQLDPNRIKEEGTLSKMGKIILMENPDINKNAESITEARRLYGLDILTNAQMAVIADMSLNAFTSMFIRYPNEFAIGFLERHGDEYIKSIALKEKYTQ